MMNILQILLRLLVKLLNITKYFTPKNRAFNIIGEFSKEVIHFEQKNYVIGIMIA